MRGFGELLPWEVKNLKAKILFKESLEGGRSQEVNVFLALWSQIVCWEMYF